MAELNTKVIIEMDEELKQAVTTIDERIKMLERKVRELESKYRKM